MNVRIIFLSKYKNDFSPDRLSLEQTAIVGTYQTKDVQYRSMTVDNIQNDASAVKESTKRRGKVAKTEGKTDEPHQKINDHDNEEHLPPIILTLVVFTCSSIVFILCLRDFWMTGKNIFGYHDDMYMVRRHDNFFCLT